jgi:hypothetical protein
MDRASFEAAFRKLMASPGAQTANVGCIGCERCLGATDSTFCVDCKQIARCQYCTGCEDSSDCAHCTNSRGLRACQHCVECQRCSDSAYLVRSVSCVNCTYCFGCVGLSRKDFHILNEPYDRQTYFATVAKLSRELGVR